MESGVLAPHVRWTSLHGAVFLLDLRRGEYLALEREHAAAWSALLGRSVAGPPPADTEVAAVRAAALARGWIVSKDRVAEPSSLSPRRPFSSLIRHCPSLWALACLLQAHLSLRWRGFAKTYEWARAQAARAAPGRSGLSALASAKARFRSVEHLVISKRGLEDCLPRSLALFVFLRGLGFPVRHRIGIRCFPFAAHAWVEAVLDAGDDPPLPEAWAPLSTIE